MSLTLDLQPRRDAELLAGAEGNDLQGFAELVARYQNRVTGYLRRLTGDPERARDLAQETFLRAWQARDKFDGRGSVKGWIFQIATNAWRDAGRRSGNDPLSHPDDSHPEEPLAHVATRADGPREQMARREHMAAVEKAIGELSPVLRAVLLLSVREELPYAEIARVLGIPMGTVSSRKAQAVAALRKRLGADG